MACWYTHRQPWLALPAQNSTMILDGSFSGFDLDAISRRDTPTLSYDVVVDTPISFDPAASPLAREPPLAQVRPAPATDAACLREGTAALHRAPTGNPPRHEGLPLPIPTRLSALQVAPLWQEAAPRVSGIEQRLRMVKCTQPGVSFVLPPFRLRITADNGGHRWWTPSCARLSSRCFALARCGAAADCPAA